MALHRAVFKLSQAPPAAAASAPAAAAARSTSQGTSVMMRAYHYDYEHGPHYLDFQNMPHRQ